MPQESYVVAGVYHGEVYELANIRYDTETTTFPEALRIIAKGFKRIAEDYEFHAIAAEYKHEQESDDETTGG